MAIDDRIARLSKQIGSDISKDQPLLLTEAELVALRRQGAVIFTRSALALWLP